MTEREQIERAIAVLEGRRAMLGDGVVDTALVALRARLAALRVPAVADQRKQVTVLFADVSGFTAMAERLDPEEVLGVINTLWWRLDQAILAHSGTIDKHIGDAVMALFGAPIAHEDDPEQAVRAALAMQSQLQVFTEEYAAAFPTLRMRIGIHTGPVLLGAVGTTAEYTAMGDTVNLASRLEHAAPVGGILISHATYRHMRGIFEVAALEPLAVKGKTAPVRVYAVHGIRPRTFRVTNRGMEGVEAPMVGRAAELAALQAAFHAAADTGGARVVTVVGEAGLGKSRLLHEFDTWLDTQPEPVARFKARTDLQLARLPYALVRDLLAYYCQIRDSDPAGTAREKLAQGVEAILGVAGEEAAAFLGHLIGFDFAASRYLEGILTDALQIRTRAFHYAAQFFAAVGRDRLPVLYLEDIHWADDGSLDLIDHLARAGEELPLLVVALTRATLFERRPEWTAGWPGHLRLDLQPLSTADSRRLVGELLGRVSNVPAALQELIISRAAGNPFYVEELIKMLIEDGVIVPGAGGWEVVPERLAAARVPSTLVGVLQARLDALPPAEQEALQRASVVGQTFWDELVGTLLTVQTEPDAAGPAALPGALDTLRHRELIFGRDPSAFVGAYEYVFKHAILRDVTYESVLKRVRPGLHAAVAHWLSTRGGERGNEYAGLIGEHYEQAGRERDAADWYIRAGKQAQSAYVPGTAIAYYEKALAFLPDDPAHAAQRLTIHEGLGEVLGWEARHADAVAAYTAMRQVAEVLGDQTATARSWNGLAVVHMQQGDYRAALQAVEQAAAAEGGGPAAERELAIALCMKGGALYRMGNMIEAERLGTEALTLSATLGARKEMAYSLNLLGTIQITLGHYQEATPYLEQALMLYRRLADRRAVGNLLGNLGVLANERGDYAAGTGHFTESLQIAREIGNRLLELGLLSNRGAGQVALGDYAAAEADLRASIAMSEGVGERAFLVGSSASLAEALVGRGHLEAAAEAAHRALILAREIEEPEAVGRCWRVLAIVAAARAQPVVVEGESYQAVACLAESLLVFTELGMEGARARTLEVWGRYAIQQGDAQGGAALRAAARAMFIRLGMVPDAERAAAALVPLAPVTVG